MSREEQERRDMHGTVANDDHPDRNKDTIIQPSDLERKHIVEEMGVDIQANDGKDKNANESDRKNAYRPEERHRVDQYHERKHSRDDSRQRKRSKSRSRTRSRSQDRNRYRSRRRYRRSSSRSRSRSRSRQRRRYRRRSYSRERDYRRRRDHRRHRSRSPSSDYGERRRNRRDRSRDKMMSIEDPFAKLRSASASVNPVQIARQMHEQQLKARLTVLQQQAATAISPDSKPQREVYVGNITPGVVTGPMLHQLFSATLKAAFPDQCEDLDPVIYVNMASEGKYGFVEVRTAEMATACLELSGQIPLGGNMLAIGRPTGYIDPSRAHASAHAAAEALEKFQMDTKRMEQEGQMVAPPSSASAIAELEKEVAESEPEAPTPFLAVDGIVCSNSDNPSESEINEVTSDLKLEFGKFGRILKLFVRKAKAENLPKQAEDETMIQDDNTKEDTKEENKNSYGIAYVQFVTKEDATSAIASMNGRLFSGQPLHVKHITATAFLENLDKKD